MRNFSCISRIYMAIGLVILSCLLSILLTNFAFDLQAESSQSAVLLQIGALMGTLLLLTPFVIALVRSIESPFDSIMRDVKGFESGDFNPLEIKFKPQGTDELAQLSQVLFNAGKDILEQRKKITSQNQLLAKKNKELEVQLQRETQARQEVDHLKTEKLGDLVNLHHELRTPLAGIVASVEMLNQSAAQGIARMFSLNSKNLPVEQFRALQEARKEIREVHTVLDEILKPASVLMEDTVDHLMESLSDFGHEIKIHKASFSLKKVITGTVKRFQGMAHKKSLVFNHQVQNNTSNKDLYFKSDWARIGQILSNLLDNAIRFTQEGGLSLKVEVNPTDREDLHRLHFIVKDTGCGISEEEKAKIFNIFHIGEDPTRKENSGLGAGLAIAQRVAERLGGRVFLAKSEIGKGSVFVFEIALETSDELDDDLPEVIETPHKLSLLYVEDSKVNRGVFKQYCTRTNINLQLAEDGIEGWEKYQKYRFDALVVDCFMPRKNGFELVEEIRAYEKENELARVPIFALTADPTNQNRERCIQVGFDEFLTKPYKMDTFNFILERSQSLHLRAKAV